MFCFQKIIAAGMLCLLVPGTAAAEWKMPNLNPFATPKTPPRTVGSQGDSGWSWWPGNQPQKSPSLWPSKPKGNSSLWPQNNSNSMWTRMTQSTKSAFTKTADFLNPFDDANDKPTYSPTGTRGISNSTPKPAGKAPWWAPYDNPEPNDRPQTVTDFLKQSRPGFDD